MMDEKFMTCVLLPIVQLKHSNNCNLCDIKCVPFVMILFGNKLSAVSSLTSCISSRSVGNSVRWMRDSNIGVNIIDFPCCGNKLLIALYSFVVVASYEIIFITYRLSLSLSVYVISSDESNGNCVQVKFFTLVCVCVLYK